MVFNLFCCFEAQSHCQRFELFCFVSFFLVQGWFQHNNKQNPIQTPYTNHLLSLLSHPPCFCPFCIPSYKLNFLFTHPFINKTHITALFLSFVRTFQLYIYQHAQKTTFVNTTSVLPWKRRDHQPATPIPTPLTDSRSNPPAHDLPPELH